MTKWILLVALIVSGLSLCGVYYLLAQQQAGLPTPLSSIPNPNAVNVVDGYDSGVHRLSGEVKLSHSCFVLSADSYIDPSDPTAVTIVLTSEDHILDHPVCAHIPTRYPFDLIVDAPQNLKLHLTLNGFELPVVVTQKAFQNPSGNTLNTQ